MITHHPTDSTLTHYAAGTLPEALALVVATHLPFCARCRRLICMIESVGGALLDSLPPAQMAPDALAQALARTGAPTTERSKPNRDPTLPPPLNTCGFGRWWPAGTGLRWRPLRVRGRAWGGLLLAQPGRRLPPHQHDGLELTCVLTGSFNDGVGHYAPGDVAEPEADHDQPPVVDSAIPCLCLVATEGFRLQGLLGLAQRLLRRAY